MSHDPRIHQSLAHPLKIGYQPISRSCMVWLFTIAAAFMLLALPAFSQTLPSATISAPVAAAPVSPVSSATVGAADSGDTAWMLTSSALVMLMMPGLALFYAGMVRRKNVLGTMMHSMAILGIIGVEWVVIGYSMAFGAT